MKVRKVLGTTEDRTECDNCGKTNLKQTVALELENNQIVYFGTTCASKATTVDGLKKSANEWSFTAKVVAAAQNWLDKGYDKKTVAEGIWNKYGCPAEVKNGELVLWLTPKAYL